MFGLRHDISEINKERETLAREHDHEEKARERDHRLTMHNLERQAHAEQVAAQTKARLDAAREEHSRQVALENARPLGGGGRDRGEREPLATESFRRFLGLGRPERV